MEHVGPFLKEHAFALLLLLTAVILAKYLHGRRHNLRLAKIVSAALEKALEPEDTQYTWIGGLAGFKAVFRLEHGVEMKATLTMSPRQSLLYYPVSRLIFGGDRLFLLFEKRTLAPGEGHLLAKGFRKKPGMWVPSPDRFDLEEDVEQGGSRYRLLAEDRATLAALKRLADRLAYPGLRHAATIADDAVTYFHLDPGTPGLDGFLEQARRTVGGTDPAARA